MIELFHYTKSEQDKLIKSITVLVDTREHDGKNEHILSYFDSKGIPWKKSKLDYGDYSFLVPANEELKIPKDLYFDKQIMVERKANLEEFSGNITEARDRIKKELALAPPNKVLVIENGSYADMIMGNYKTKYDSKSYWATVHSFWHEFDIPIIFMPDPKYTGIFIWGYFKYYFYNVLKG